VREIPITHTNTPALKLTGEMKVEGKKSEKMDEEQ
jgi:hypothetical protein